MNILDVIERFPNQEACIAYLEKARWDNTPVHCVHTVRVSTWVERTSLVL